MITLKQKTTLVEKVAIIPIIAEVIAIIWLFIEYIIQSNTIGFSEQPFPVLIWWITPMLLIDILIGIRLRLFGFSIKVVFIIVYGLTLFPNLLGTSVLGSFMLALLLSSALWIYIERAALWIHIDGDARSKSGNSYFEPLTNKYIYGKWFSKNSPFAPLVEGGYFYQQQEPYIQEVLQLSAEVKNEYSVYSDRVETVGIFMIFGAIPTACLSLILINLESNNQAVTYSGIAAAVTIILLIPIKVIFFKNINQQVALIQSSLCDCLDSSIALNALLSQKADLWENYSSLTIASGGDRIAIQINTIIDTLSLFGKELEKFKIISLKNTRKVRKLTQVHALNKILSEDLLNKTQLTRMYTQEIIGKYKKALQSYTKELPTDESAAGTITTIRLGEIIRSFENIYPESTIQIKF